MTQTAEKPISLTYDKLHEKFQTNFPDLLPPLELIKPKLDRGEGAQELANIISCEVTRSEEPTAFVYTWVGQKGQAFECRVLKPFEPTPSPKADAPEMPVEEPQNPDEPEAAQTDAQAPTEAQESPEETPEPPADPPKAESSTPSPSPGLFSALSELIGNSTLLMTLAKNDDELTVNVMPFGEDKESSISAICVTATPHELDTGFADVIRVKVEGRKSLAEQVEALKEAEKALADAKKSEADAKKAEGEKKKKAADDKKKEEEKKKADEEKEAEKAKAQEALF